MKNTVCIAISLSACSEYDFIGKTEATPAERSPQIQVDPTLIDFGTRSAIDTSADTRLVVIENIGTDTLDVWEVLLVETTSVYSISVLTDMRLDPEESGEFSVTFTPGTEGIASTDVQISSNDPENEIVIVELLAEVQMETPDTGDPPSDPEIPDDTGTPPDPDPPGSAPDILLFPPSHDFGLLSAGDVVDLKIDILNEGDADLVVNGIDYDTTTGELSLDPDHALNGAFPWHISPGASASIWVNYSPTDGTSDSSVVTVLSNDPDEPAATADQFGSARTFEGFSTGWYIYDDGLAHETHSSSSYVVDHHGDSDLYWYEPSGAHGLIGSADPTADFAILRDYVIDRAGSPTVVSGPLNFSSGSTLATYEYATFTHILCDFYIEPGDDPASYEVSARSVDDGIQVIVNSEIMGYMRLGDGTTTWSLADVGRPGEVNTLVVILADDSAVNRYLNDLAFYKDGVIVE